MLRFQEGLSKLDQFVYKFYNFSNLIFSTNIEYICLILVKNNVVYQKALIRTFHTRSLTTHYTITFEKPVLNVHFKDFWYIKINPTLNLV